MTCNCPAVNHMAVRYRNKRRGQHPFSTYVTECTACGSIWATAKQRRKNRKSYNNAMNRTARAATEMN